MKVTAFDFYDKDRKKPVELDMKKVQVGAEFEIDDVTYKITKVFFSSVPQIKGKCVELKTVRYKIKNSVTTFSHKCNARMGMMKKMGVEHREEMVKKYGKKTVESWEAGRVKMRGHLATRCPDCECVFWKEKLENPEAVEIISLKGKKKLIKRM